jgi:cephalosporin hydroxylase
LSYLNLHYQPQQNAEELAEFLLFVQSIQAKRYLEIGSKFGGSLWAVANVMPVGSRIVSVDLPNAKWGRSDSEEALINCVNELERLGYDSYLIFGDSAKKSVVEAVRDLGPFDLVFIDADHVEQAVWSDFQNYGMMTQYCCFHDVGQTSEVPAGRRPIEVRKVWNDLKKIYHDRAEFREIMHDKGINGIGIMRWLHW